MMPSVEEMEAYIRQEALARGINPDVAVRVARTEGLARNTWQSNVRLAYGRERSYGPFQLHVAPQGYRPGMGNDFANQTGLDPADPRNWQQGVSFALDNAKRGGWGPWFGAKKIGITGMMGIDGTPVSTRAPSAPAGAPQQPETYYPEGSPYAEPKQPETSDFGIASAVVPTASTGSKDGLSFFQRQHLSAMERGSTPMNEIDRQKQQFLNPQPAKFPKLPQMTGGK
jgi:hypothetical protein